MRCTLVCYLLLQDAGGGEHDFKKLKKKKGKEFNKYGRLLQKTNNSLFLLLINNILPSV
jgi:hypothetical protein